MFGSGDPRLAHRPVAFSSAFSTILLSESIRTVLPVSDQNVVVDVGGGEAPYAPWVTSCLHLAIDYRSPSATHASHQVVGDATRLPVAAGVADLVLCTEVVEHVQDDRALYHELRRIIQPAGVLIMSAPFVHGLHESPHDYRRPTSAGLLHGLTSAGFNVIRMIPVGSTGDVMIDQAVRTMAPKVRGVARRCPAPIGQGLADIYTAMQVSIADRSFRRSRGAISGMDPLRPEPRLPLGYVVLAKPA